MASTAVLHPHVKHATSVLHDRGEEKAVTQTPLQLSRGRLTMAGSPGVLPRRQQPCQLYKGHAQCRLPGSAL